MSMGSGPLFGSGGYYGNGGGMSNPRGPFGPWAGCGCSSFFMIAAGMLLVMGGCLRMIGQ